MALATVCSGSSVRLPSRLYPIPAVVVACARSRNSKNQCTKARARCPLERKETTHKRLRTHSISPLRAGLAQMDGTEVILEKDTDFELHLSGRQLDEFPESARNKPTLIYVNVRCVCWCIDRSCPIVFFASWSIGGEGC